MNEQTKCLIFKGCYDAFFAALASDADNVIVARVSGEEARHSAAAQLAIVTIDTLYKMAAGGYQHGDDIEALCADTVSEMTIERLGVLADQALHPPPERLN